MRARTKSHDTAIIDCDCCVLGTEKGSYPITKLFLENLFMEYTYIGENSALIDERFI